MVPLLIPPLARARTHHQGPGLSGWKTNPAVKGVEGGRTVSLPGYYKEEDQVFPKWAQVLPCHHAYRYALQEEGTFCREHIL